MSFQWIISKFKDYVDLIYLIEPEIKSTTRYGLYIVLHIEINSKDRFKTKLIIFDMNYLYDMSRNHGVIKKKCWKQHHGYKIIRRNRMRSSLGCRKTEPLANQGVNYIAVIEILKQGYENRRRSSCSNWLLGILSLNK